MQGFKCKDLHGRDPIQACIKAIKHNKSDDIFTMSEGVAKEEGQEGDIAKDAHTEAKCDGFDLILFASAVGSNAFKDAIGT